MRNEAPTVTGLCGDLGWNEADDAWSGGFSTTLLMVASGAVWGSLWLLGGLPPISFLASRVRLGREIVDHHESTYQRKWRSYRA